MTFVHPTAEVEPTATIGDGASVWRLSHLRAGASVGAGCNLGRNGFINVGIRIGDRELVLTVVCHRAFIGVAPVPTTSSAPSAS